MRILLWILAVVMGLAFGFLDARILRMQARNLMQGPDAMKGKFIFLAALLGLNLLRWIIILTPAIVFMALKYFWQATAYFLICALTALLAAIVSSWRSKLNGNAK